MEIATVIIALTVGSIVVVLLNYWLMNVVAERKAFEECKLVSEALSEVLVELKGDIDDHLHGHTEEIDERLDDLEKSEPKLRKVGRPRKKK